MDLRELRLQIDNIDGELLRLFEHRMDVCAEIAKYKKRNGIPIYDPNRERQKLADLTQKVKKGREAHVSAVFTLLFEISRAEQEALINKE